LTSLSLEEYLLKDERVLAKAEASPLGDYLYATNHRVIRYKKEEGGSSGAIDSLYYPHYPHVFSVSLENTSFVRPAITGAGMAALGVIVLYVNARVLNDLFLLILSVLFLISGIIFALKNLYIKPQDYKIKVEGRLSDKVRIAWHVQEVNSPEVKAFVKFVQDQINKREIQAPLVSFSGIRAQTLPSESAEKSKTMITPSIAYCQYCGKENKVDAVICGYCGKDISN
jgi:hypothetical protein